MKLFILVALMALNLNINPVKQFNKELFDMEYKKCFASSGISYMDRNAVLVVKECRMLAMNKIKLESK